MALAVGAAVYSILNSLVAFEWAGWRPSANDHITIVKVFGFAHLQFPWRSMRKLSRFYTIVRDLNPDALRCISLIGLVRIFEMRMSRADRHCSGCKAGGGIGALARKLETHPVIDDELDNLAAIDHRHVWDSMPFDDDGIADGLGSDHVGDWIFVKSRDVVLGHCASSFLALKFARIHFR